MDDFPEMSLKKKKILEKSFKIEALLFTPDMGQLKMLILSTNIDTT